MLGGIRRFILSELLRLSHRGLKVDGTIPFSPCEVMNRKTWCHPGEQGDEQTQKLKTGKQKNRMKSEKKQHEFQMGAKQHGAKQNGAIFFHPAGVFDFFSVRLSHPRLIPLVGACLESQRLALLTELAPGNSPSWRLDPFG